MAADLLALEHEIREGRLSLDCFCNGKLVIARFREGSLEFDYESDAGSVPEGYILRYGPNRKGELEYFIKLDELITAESSEKWMNAALHTKARAYRGGMKVRKVDCLIKGYRTKAEFGWNEWNTARQYAVKVKRAKSLKELPKELEAYTYQAMNHLSDHLRVPPRKYPDVELKRSKTASGYNIPENRIIFTTINHSAIYEEAGRCLHAGYMPKTGGENYPLDILFRKTLEETIGYYCAKFGDRSKTIGGSMLQNGLSGQAESAETQIADAILNLEIDAREADMLSHGIICRQELADANSYVKTHHILSSLSNHLGAKMGERIFAAKGKDIIEKLIISEDTRYPRIFFRTARNLRMMDAIHADVIAAIKAGKR